MTYCTNCGRKPCATCDAARYPSPETYCPVCSQRRDPPCAKCAPRARTETLGIEKELHGLRADQQADSEKRYRRDRLFYRATQLWVIVTGVLAVGLVRTTVSTPVLMVLGIVALILCTMAAAVCHSIWFYPVRTYRLVEYFWSIKVYDGTGRQFSLSTTVSVPVSRKYMAERILIPRVCRTTLPTTDEKLLGRVYDDYVSKGQ